MEELRHPTETYLNNNRGVGLVVGKLPCVLFRGQIEEVTRVLQSTGDVQELMPNVLGKRVPWTRSACIAFQLAGLEWCQILFNDDAGTFDYDYIEDLSNRWARDLRMETVCLCYDMEHGVKFYTHIHKYGIVLEHFQGMEPREGSTSSSRQEPLPHHRHNFLITDRLLRELDAFALGEHFSYFTRRSGASCVWEPLPEEGASVTITNYGHLSEYFKVIMDFSRVDYFILSDEVSDRLYA